MFCYLWLDFVLFHGYVEAKIEKSEEIHPKDSIEEGGGSITTGARLLKRV
jgi:hypothetical protein